MRVPALLRSTHLGPSMLVCFISFVLTTQVLSFLAAVEVTAAIFCGQCFIGWSNELLDLESDRSAKRTRKPLVNGALDPKTLRNLLPISLALAIIISLLSPLHVKGTMMHVGGLVSATLYNLWLKRTWLSFIPYMVSFALLPMAIYSAASTNSPVWLLIAFVTVAVAFHFLNVLKDIDEDRRQGIFGLPQRVGRRTSQFIAFLLLVFAIADIVFLR